MFKPLIPVFFYIIVGYVLLKVIILLTGFDCLLNFDHLTEKIFVKLDFVMLMGMFFIYIVTILSNLTTAEHWFRGISFLLVVISYFLTLLLNV